MVDTRPQAVSPWKAPPRAAVTPTPCPGGGADPPEEGTQSLFLIPGINSDSVYQETCSYPPGLGLTQRRGQKEREGVGPWKPQCTCPWAPPRRGPRVLVWICVMSPQGTHIRSESLDPCTVIQAPTVNWAPPGAIRRVPRLSGGASVRGAEAGRFMSALLPAAHAPGPGQRVSSSNPSGARGRPGRLGLGHWCTAALQEGRAQAVVAGRWPLLAFGCEVLVNEPLGDTFFGEKQKPPYFKLHKF